MLIYSKKVDEKMKLFGTLNNIPSDEDELLTYTDGEGKEVEPELSLSQSFVDGGKHSIKRVEDGKEIKVFIGDVNVIPGESSPVPPTPPVEGPYLTFSSAEPFTISVSLGRIGWNGIMEYSTDAKSWTEWDGTEISSSDINKLYIRGTNNVNIIDYIKGEWTEYYSWILTGNNISCSGNIENLLDYQTVANGEHPEMGNYCFAWMFDSCTSLIKAPELPATTLSNWCYHSMFQGCSSLTTAPELPATILASGCYASMFQGCSSLTTPPELPAATLADSCYTSMFYGCTSLVTTPTLPAVVLYTHCYNYMFEGCTSLTSLPALSATTLANSCYAIMFDKCNSIKLSETQDSDYTTPYRIPVEGGGVDADGALYYMFTDTGGTFTGTPTINTTYYLHKDNHIV